MTINILPFRKSLRCKKPEDILRHDYLQVIIGMHNEDPNYRKRNGILSPFEVKTDPDKAMRLRLFFQERVITNLNNTDEERLNTLLGRTISLIRQRVALGIALQSLSPQEDSPEPSASQKPKAMGFSKITFTPSRHIKKRKKKRK